MSALRQRLRRPETYLALVSALLAWTAYDATREPRSQTLANLYTRSVELYQGHGRAVSSRIFQCRYRPTCSEYSRQAVGRYGIAAGLRLTLRRLASCRAHVPMGTEDPVR